MLVRVDMQNNRNEWNNFLIDFCLTEMEHFKKEIKEKSLIWRKHIYARDSRRCVKCGSKGSIGTKNGAIFGPINIHHIYPKYLFPSAQFRYDNAITLCGVCHAETVGEELQFVDEMKLLIESDITPNKERLSFDRLCIRCGKSNNTKIKTRFLCECGTFNDFNIFNEWLELRSAAYAVLGK